MMDVKKQKLKDAREKLRKYQEKQKQQHVAPYETPSEKNETKEDIQNSVEVTKITDYFAAANDTNQSGSQNEFEQLSSNDLTTRKSESPNFVIVENVNEIVSDQVSEVSSSHSELQSIMVSVDDTKPSTEHLSEISPRKSSQTAFVSQEGGDILDARSNNEHFLPARFSPQSHSTRTPSSVNNSHEINEYKERLDALTAQNIRLRDEVHQKSSQLELTELNLSQLKSMRGVVHTSKHEDVHDESKTEELEKKVEDLKQQVDTASKREKELSAYIYQVTKDRESIISQYTTYGQKLTSKIEVLHKETTEKTATIQKLEDIIVNKNKQIDRLNEAFNSQQSRRSHESDLLIQNLKQKIKQLEEEQIKREDVSVENLVEQKNEVASVNFPNSDSNSDLLKELEGCRVATSLATSQNVTLKERLGETQDDLEDMRKQKMSLMAQIEVLQDSLTQKSDFIGSLQTSNASLKGLVDDHNIKVEHMKEQNALYMAFAENCVRSGGGQPINEEEKDESGSVGEEMSVSVDVDQNVTGGGLESKLLEAHTKISSLTSERDRLEHLIVQLQDETETIGDYITIYQFKREEMKKKLAEKDDEIASVARESHHLKRQLAKLAQLVKSFIGQRKVDKFDVEPSNSEVVKVSSKDSKKEESVVVPETKYEEKTSISVESNIESTSTLKQQEKMPMPICEDNVSLRDVNSNISTTSSNSESRRLNQILDLMADIEGSTLPELYMQSKHGRGRRIAKGGDSNDENDNLEVQLAQFEPWFWEPTASNLMSV